MVDFTPQTFDLSNINGGQRYNNGDAPDANAINAPIEASAYAQALAATQPDVSEAGNVGTPNVQIIVDQTTGLPKFKFSNLKGAQGEQGEPGETPTGNEQYLAVCSTAANVQVKEVTIPDMSQLIDHAEISVFFVNGNTASSPSLKINDLSAIPLHSGSMYADTISNIGSFASGWQKFVYSYSDGKFFTGQYQPIAVKSSRSTMYVQYPFYFKAGEAIEGYSLIAAKQDGKYYNIAASLPINITYPIINTDSSIAANASSTGSKPGYISCNCTYPGYAFIQDKPIYLVGVLSGLTFTLDSTTFITQTEPSTEDGKHYMLLGIATGQNTLFLSANHPIYVYKNDEFSIYGSGGSGSEYIAICETAANVAAKTVTIPDFTYIETGFFINIYFKYGNTVANPTLNINNTGAYPILLNGGGEGITAEQAFPKAGWCTFFGSSDHLYLAGNTFPINVSLAAQSYSSQKTQDVLLSDTSIDFDNTQSGVYYKQAESPYKYSRLSASGEKKIDITYPIVYKSASVLLYSSSVSKSYIGFESNFTRNALIFLKGTLAGNIFTLDSTTPITQTVPSSADGKYYILLGFAISQTNFALFSEHPIYAYINGAFSLYATDGVGSDVYVNSVKQQSVSFNSDPQTQIDQKAYSRIYTTLSELQPAVDLSALVLNMAENSIFYLPCSAYSFLSISAYLPDAITSNPGGVLEVYRGKPVMSNGTGSGNAYAKLTSSVGFWHCNISLSYVDIGGNISVSCTVGTWRKEADINSLYVGNFIKNSNFAANSKGALAYSKFGQDANLTTVNDEAVDNWHVYADTVPVVITPNSNGVTVYAPSGYSQEICFSQTFPNFINKFIAGKVATLSIEFNEATDYPIDLTNGFGTIPANSTSYVHTATFSGGTGAAIFGFQNQSTGFTANIKSVKLELGDNATKYIPPINEMSVVNSLSSNSAKDALSAAKGKELSDSIGAIIERFYFGDSLSATPHSAIKLEQNTDFSVIGRYAASAQTGNERGLIIGNDVTFGGNSTMSRSVAIGNRLNVGSGAVAINDSDTANATPTTANNSVAIGINADATGAGTVSIGNSASADTANGVAIGASSWSKTGGIAIGAHSTEQNGGTAIGSYVSAIYPNSVHIGNYANSLGQDTNNPASSVFVSIGDTPNATALQNLAHLFNVGGLNVIDYDSTNQVYYIPAALLTRAPKTQLVDNLTSTDTTKGLTANQGKVLKGYIDAINLLLASDDTDLDTLQEIVTYIKNNKSVIDNVTITKVNISDIIDNLTSQVTNKPLSANQGYVLKGLYDGIPSWAKQTNKPTYTASEVGAEPAFTKNTAFNKNFGNASGTVCEGNDSRLSDSRPASDVSTAVKAITSTQISNWDAVASSPAASITAQQVSNWNTVASSPAASITSSQITKWDSSELGISVGTTLSQFVFNPSVDTAKLESMLSALSYDVPTGMTGENEIATVVETDIIESIYGVYGVYCVDMTKFGGTGHTLALCTANENGVQNVDQVLYCTEYSAINEGILQYFPGLSNYTYSTGGWQDSTAFSIGTTTELLKVANNKVSAFIGKDTKLWDILSMFDPSASINAALTQLNTGTGV